MCVDIDVDNSEETLRALMSIAENRLVGEIKDECSLGILQECTFNSYDAMCHALGRSLFNSIIVESLTAKIAEEKSANEHDNED